MAPFSRPSVVSFACWLALAVGGVGCTETVPLDPHPLADRGATRVALDLGLDALDGAPPATADGAAPDAAADVAFDGGRADGFDADPVDGQNGG